MQATAIAGTQVTLLNVNTGGSGSQAISGTVVPSGSGVSAGGAQGSTGPTGTTGAQGPQGVPGPSTVSADSGNIAKVGSDSYIYVPAVRFGGRLNYVSATQLSFTPFNGGYIKINGVAYPIPTGGIAGLTNTGCYIDGVIGNLAAYTIYRVYCFNNAGTLTADFSTTAHVTSTTAGNVGTEIKSGNDTRSFIGLIYGGSPYNFTDSTISRYVRTWFNRKSAGVNAIASASGYNTLNTWNAVVNAYMVTFLDETLTFCTSGIVIQTAAGIYVQGFQCYLNGAGSGQAVQASNPAQNTYVAMSSNNTVPAPSEGVQTIGGAIFINGGPANYYIQITAQAF
jgi:hypothetical protein